MGLASVFVVGRFSSRNTALTRAPLSPEAKAAATARLNDAMRKACERMELAKAERDADELARAMVRLCDEIGPNI